MVDFNVSQFNENYLNSALRYFYLIKCCKENVLRKCLLYTHIAYFLNLLHNLNHNLLIKFVHMYVICNLKSFFQLKLPKVYFVKQLQYFVLQGITFSRNFVLFF